MQQMRVSNEEGVKKVIGEHLIELADRHKRSNDGKLLSSFWRNIKRSILKRLSKQLCL